MENRAPQRIRQHFRREEREDTERSGRDLLIESLRREGMAGAKVLQSRAFGRVVKDVGFAQPEDLFAAIGSGRIAVKQVISKVVRHVGAVKEAMPEPEMLPAQTGSVEEPAAPSSDFGILVDGMSDIVVRLARCCMPIPGDDIVGYLGRGEGLTVHTADCSTAKSV